MVQKIVFSQVTKIMHPLMEGTRKLREFAAEIVDMGLVLVLSVPKKTAFLIYLFLVKRHVDGCYLNNPHRVEFVELQARTCKLLEFIPS